MNNEKLTMPKESLILLKKVLGKTLIKIRSLNEGENDSTYASPFILDFDDGSSIAIYADETSIEYCGDIDEFGKIFCEGWNNNEKTYKYFYQRITPLKINNIEVVTEEVTEHNTKFGDNTLFLDVAVIFHSENHFLTFSLAVDTYWTCWLDKTKDINIDTLRPFNEIKQHWYGSKIEDNIIKVNRISKML